ncbi:MAG: hypothetical protein FWE06_09455 [Oscillospiraceae bacterium]|nr:hypothetical protein [Oscillospiraceae bacterium]
MAQEKIGFEQFLDAVDADNQAFIQELHTGLIDSGCKATFEEKKSGYLASYKYGKPPRAVANVLFRKKGVLVRIYGEHIGQYPEFLQTLPEEMVQSIESAGICKRLVHNTCSPKCAGYDFVIGNERYQKCRYNCFEFLVTDISKSCITSFVEREIQTRAVV